MIYYVNPSTPRFVTPTFLQILTGELPEQAVQSPNLTVTRKRRDGVVPDSKTPDTFNAEDFILALEQYRVFYDPLYSSERHSLYHTFRIPKKSGGLRKIDAPNDELKKALDELKQLFDMKIGTKFHHTSAYAYVKERCPVDAVRCHQNNESEWFAKFDFSNFFGSTTMETVMRMASMIYPLNLVCASERGKTALKEALELAFLDGGLPQGTPISPFLTNLMMIPFDHEMTNYCGTHTPHYIYTRYADDIVVSCRQSFDFREVEQKINSILGNFQMPFRIKAEKTHYCSRKGKNFILGVCLNKDNNITIGHRNKKVFESMLTHFATDTIGGTFWSLDDVYHLQGKISYYLSIERDYINYLIRQYSTKFGVNITETIKRQLKGERVCIPQTKTHR
ncbi:MAG: reverse transcriptase family protein [Bacteroides sp.]|nr:reverse transcriptase family protein [Eubacterium sp.]MCM1418152.1 reverse transcriptase family protein [Roseburia sp.]MCM1462323.1 reverse transcriptase family protein [Bacteroides sp.]